MPLLGVFRSEQEYEVLMWRKTDTERDGNGRKNGPAQAQKLTNGIIPSIDPISPYCCDALLIR